MQPTTLTLGAMPLPTLRASLAAARVRHNAYAETLLPRVSIGPERRVRVASRTVDELGHPDGIELSKLWASLELAPLELALHLRLAWRPVPRRLTVPCAHPGPTELSPRGFYLRDDAEGCWLRAYVASDDWVVPPDELLAILEPLGS